LGSLIVFSVFAATASPTFADFVSMTLSNLAGIGGAPLCADPEIA